MAVLKNVDIERTLLDHLQANLEIPIHFPGEVFSPEGRAEWIEPRIASIDFDEISQPGEEAGLIAFTIRCFIATEQKGKRRLQLSTLVDKVLDVVGGERRVNGVEVLNVDEVTVSTLQFLASSQTRDDGVTAVISGVSIRGLDVATIGASVQITPC